MNITNIEQCIGKWEDEMDTIPPVPFDDEARVAHEIDVLYREMYDLFLMTVYDTSF